MRKPTGISHSLGITLYECATAGSTHGQRRCRRSRCCLGDPRDYVADLSPELVRVILRAIAPSRADRFTSATEFREALAAVAKVRVTPSAPVITIAPKPDTGALALFRPHRQNFNPFVTHLLTMYSQSPTTNAGTRGLNDVGRETYIHTLLDDKLRPDVLAGKFRLVVVTGNAGDGKTAFINWIEDATEVKPSLVRKANGSEFTLRGRRFITNYDGSQDEDTKANEDVLEEFFFPFASKDDSTWPTNETRIIAINEGRFVDFLTEHEDRYPRLRALVMAGLDGAPAADGVVAVNLNLRAVVADPLAHYTRLDLRPASAPLRER